MERFTTLFPPIVDNYTPAFDAVTNYQTSTFKFYFAPSIANDISQIRSLMIRFRRVNTNTNPLPINTYPYEVMWFDESSIIFDKTLGKYYINVPIKIFISSDAQTESENIPNYFKGLDEFYKMQVRLSQYQVRKENSTSGRWEYLLPSNDLWTAMNSTFMQDGYGKFSEWSSASLVKPIIPPVFRLSGFKGFQQDVQDWTLENLPTATFNFVGTYYSKDSRELLKSYRFRILSYDFTQYSEQGPNNNNVLEDSGWRNIGEYDALNVNWVNKIQFLNKSRFWVQYEVETINGYIGSNYYLMESNFTEYPVSVNLDVMAIHDLAKVEIKLDTSLVDTTKVDKMAILRTSSRTSDLVYDEIATFEILQPGEVIYSDYFVESGVKYKYYVQPIGVNGDRGAVSEYQEVVLDYDYTWLVGEEFFQCSIEYNGNVGNFRKVRKDSVMETIGGKFPFVVSNSNSGYIDMSYSCTLTQYMDKENLFGGSYSQIYSGVQDKTVDDFYQLSLLERLAEYDDNYITEREFRNKFTDWVQNGKAKIYKSNTEGIILVRVVDFNTTPIQQLGRMISSATFRMIEIGDVTNENLIKFGLKKKSYTDVELREIYSRSIPYPEVNRDSSLTGYSFVRKDW